MKKILILEDERVLADIYRKYLEEAGFEVKCVENVDSAVASLNDYCPDLTLVDHGIKGRKKNGLDFIPKLKKNCPKSRIVMLSNYNYPELREAAKKAGAEDFFVKLNTPPSALLDYVNNLFS